jgi:hypothetical protein
MGGPQNDCDDFRVGSFTAFQFFMIYRFQYTINNTYIATVLLIMVSPFLCVGSAKV